MARIELRLMGAVLVLDDRQCGLRPDLRLVLLTQRPEGWRCSAMAAGCAHERQDGCHLNTIGEEKAGP